LHRFLANSVLARSFGNSSNAVPTFVTIAGREFMLHTTSMASGTLLILMGILLASGNLATISEWTRQTSLAQFTLSMEQWLNNLITRP
jgi:hypothetical protein